MPIPDILSNAYRTLLRLAWAPPPLLDVLGLSRWLHQNMAGIAIVQNAADDYGLEMYLVTPFPLQFQVALSGQLGPWSGIVRFVVTGRFRFLNGLGIGSDISINGCTGGKIGLFVKDAQGGAYALTCSHVLDEVPSGQPVCLGQAVCPIGDGTAKLAYRTPISTAGMAAPGMPEPNSVDGALASIPAALPNVTQDGKPIAGFANYNCGDAVLDAVTGGNMGTIRSVVASIKVPYPRGGTDVFFGGVIIVSATNAEHFAVPGDSGSLVVTEPPNAAVGLAFAAPEGFLAGAPVGLDPSVSVVICDLHRTLQALEQRMPTNLRPLSFV